MTTIIGWAIALTIVGAFAYQAIFALAEVLL